MSTFGDVFFVPLTGETRFSLVHKESEKKNGRLNELAAVNEQLQVHWTMERV